MPHYSKKYPTLKQMRKDISATTCAFCLEPVSFPRKTCCGDVVCIRAYNRVYQRGRRQGLLVRNGGIPRLASIAKRIRPALTGVRA